MLLGKMSFYWSNKLIIACDSPAVGKVIANLKVQACFFAFEHQFWVPSFYITQLHKPSIDFNIFFLLWKLIFKTGKINRNNFYVKKNILFFLPTSLLILDQFYLNRQFFKYVIISRYVVLYFNQLELTKVSFKTYNKVLG